MDKRITKRVCKSCEVLKDLEDFNKNRQNPMGIATLCRICERAKARANYTGRRQKITPERRLLGSATYRAKKKGLEFDLTLDWIKERIDKGFCEVTGMAFGAAHTPTTPSIDRRDNSKGYTKDNVQITTWMYNMSKGVFTHADVMEMVKHLSGGIH